VIALADAMLMQRVIPNTNRPAGGSHPWRA
jgi:hypothetical protein